MIGAGAEDGFRTIELAYAAYEALEKGTVVKLAERQTDAAACGMPAQLRKNITIGALSRMGGLSCKNQRWQLWLRAWGPGSEA